MYFYFNLLIVFNKQIARNRYRTTVVGNPPPEFLRFSDGNDLRFRSLICDNDLFFGTASSVVLSIYFSLAESCQHENNVLSVISKTGKCSNVDLHGTPDISFLIEKINMGSPGSSGGDSLGGKPRAIELTSHDSLKDEQISLQPSMIRSLDEVKGAFETEAESHILQAIEEAENEYEDESAADSRPSLLDGVPSHAAHLFSHLLEKPPPRRSSATPIDPFEPNMGKPRLKDVANRMRMMQMATKMRSQRGLSVNSESNQGTVPDGDQAAQGTVDPESLENGDNSGHGSDFDTNPSMVRDTSRATKTFYRRHCAPCYTFTNFLKVRWTDIKYQVMMVIYLMVPCLGVAAILYYFMGNPEGPYNSSYSWWLIFIVRLSVTRLLAQLSQFILIDFICLETRLAVMSVGRMLTLMAVQAKGWPLVSVLWAAWNLAILGKANSHWLSMQTFFDIFNSKNYGGDFLVSDTYRRILAAVFIVGFVVMVKRVCIALVLGKRTYGKLPRNCIMAYS